MRLNMIKKKIELKDVGKTACFVPFTKSIDDYNKLKIDEFLSVSVKRGRLVPFSAKYWAICDLVSNNNEVYTDKRTVHFYNCMRTQFVHMHVIDGVVHYESRSVSFGECSQKDFEAFYEKAIIVMSDLLECSVEDLEKNYLKFM